MVAGFLIAGILFMATFAFLYVKYEGIVDRRMSGQIFNNTAKIYARPQIVQVGDKLSAAEIVGYLRRAGYSEQGKEAESPVGQFRLSGGSLEVIPGEESFHATETATLHFDGGKVSAISLAGRGSQAASAYELEPQMITSLFGSQDRSKRQLVTFDEIPKDLVNATIAIEDRRFFQHSGVNYYRLMEAAATDIFHGHRGQGGSTLTMQLSRGFFLTPEKTIKRKLTEMLIAMELEQKFSKQRIFQMYANQVPMGQRGSFSINGFGEAARAYFNKDIKDLTLPECALLAGLIQRPSYLSPYRHPERALERRNLVLDSMVETGAITHEQAEQAKNEGLDLSDQSVDASEAPYFVDLVHDQLLQKLGDRDFNREGLRIYTTLDPDLQREATEAVETKIHVVDQLVDRLHARRKKRGIDTPLVYPQVALVALNPHTGQVLALVGGRSYGTSQLNHAVSARPTGSIFKPFVYASAFATAAEGVQLPGQDKLFSPVTILNDEQTTYEVGDKEYTPRNFEGEYHGLVTARVALQRSLNNATIALAGMVGFDRVAELARQSGVKSARGTPSVAIGAYDATPLEMAGAYTVFANNGLHIDPWMVASVRTPTGDIVSDYTPTSRQVLDPRVAYLTTRMMEDVLSGIGTGAGVRNMGFLAPAAGKTGTEHDAWFAGYTTNLLCIVWIGNDDYTDIKLQGAFAAGPIWAEFMKNAVKLPQYSDTHDFTPPDGVQVVQLDKVSNLLSDAACPDSYEAAFLNGTAPTNTCDHPPDNRNFFQKLLGLGNKSGN